MLSFLFTFSCHISSSASIWLQGRILTKIYDLLVVKTFFPTSSSSSSTRISSLSKWMDWETLFCTCTHQIAKCDILFICSEEGWTSKFKDYVIRQGLFASANTKPLFEGLWILMNITHPLSSIGTTSTKTIYAALMLYLHSQWWSINHKYVSMFSNTFPHFAKLCVPLLLSL